MPVTFNNTNLTNIICGGINVNYALARAAKEGHYTQYNWVYVFEKNNEVSAIPLNTTGISMSINAGLNRVTLTIPQNAWGSNPNNVYLHVVIGFGAKDCKGLFLGEGNAWVDVIISTSGTFTHGPMRSSDGRGAYVSGCSVSFANNFRTITINLSYPFLPTSGVTLLKLFARRELT